MRAAQRDTLAELRSAITVNVTGHVGSVVAANDAGAALVAHAKHVLGVLAAIEALAVQCDVATDDKTRAQVTIALSNMQWLIGSARQRAVEVCSAAGDIKRLLQESPESVPAPLT